MRKICIVSGTRAEYGLLYWLIKGVNDDPDLELQLIVTGMHLSPEFGLTWKQIEKDGFKITKKLEILLSSDTSVGISKAIGLANISFADAFSELQPDVVLLLGDRFEILATATAALIARIPIVHCHGGELTEGAIDDAFRHAITKMSHIHFTSTEKYKDRVIQLGEQPKNVYNVGALGIENIKRIKLLNKRSFEKAINFELKERNFLITFHPVTLEDNSAETQFSELLKVLNILQNTGFIFTLPNADTGGRVIFELINSFVEQNKENAVAFKSMGQLNYLSALQYVDAVIGNSSSGLLEAPSFKIGTINIGDRQKGRIKADSIIDCDANYYSIEQAITTLYSNNFRKILLNTQNPYDQGLASEKILRVLKSIDLNGILKKSFYE